MPEILATGCEVYADGFLTILLFYVERRAMAEGPLERSVVARVCVPSQQFPEIVQTLTSFSRATWGDSLPS